MGYGSKLELLLTNGLREAYADLFFFCCQSFSLKTGKLLKNVGCSRKSVVFSLEFQ